MPVGLASGPQMPFWPAGRELRRRRRRPMHPPSKANIWTRRGSEM